MIHKDKQDVIAICNILADKMSDSGKVAVQQIIDAVKDMIENEPCEDAISRAVLLEELGEEPFNWNDSPEEYQEVRDYQWFRSLVENAPSVIPQPKIGRWITWKEAGNEIPSETRFECSVCHDAAQTLCNGLDLLSSYCPNCGAKMEVSDG